jgi:alginate lyase
VVGRNRIVSQLYARRGFVTGLAVGLAVPLVAGAILFGGSPGGHHRAVGATSSLGSEPGPGASGTPLTTVAASAPAVAGPIPLDGWKLTLPVNSKGALSGTAKQLTAAAITAPWLTRNADGSLTFWAPAQGAKTANSLHARTELVSTRDWTFGSGGAHTLSATLAVSQVPQSDPDICIGQLHGGGKLKSIPFVMLHYRDGNIVVIVKQVMHGSTSQSITLSTGIPINGVFSYTITDNGNGTLGLSATYNGQTRQQTAKVVSAFMGTDERFQVGDYQQATTAASSTDGGRVTFYALNVS